MATVNANAGIAERYHEPLWGRMDRALRNCFTAAGIIGVALLIAIFVVPLPPPMPVTVDDVPERIARLILEKPRPAPAVPAPEPVAMEQPRIETPPEKAKPKPPPRQRTSKPKVSQDRGTQGRQKAQQEVAQNLASVSGSLDKVLADVSKALPATDAQEPAKKQRRRRGVRSGRGSDQLSSVGGSADLSAPDVSGSAIETRGISIAAISDLTVQDGGGGGVSPGSGGSGSARSGSGELRSNESLLGVVRRYAPGIQFCYDNELKKSPGLRGKLVVSLRVLAGGQVADVQVVEDTLRSSGVRNCVLAQIRGWQFPAIPQGDVSFKTPFVFTPPE